MLTAYLFDALIVSMCALIDLLTWCIRMMTAVLVILQWIVLVGIMFTVVVVTVAVGIIASWNLL